MKIWSYTFSNADDADVLPTALNSLSKFCDRMFLVDSTVEASMIRRVRRWGRLLDYLHKRPEYEAVIHSDVMDFERYWNGTRLVCNTRSFTKPGEMRNWCEWRMLQDGMPDWIVGLDSDEIASHEMINEIRPFLESLSPEMTNVVQPLVSLVVDEHHMASPYPSWLAHARIYRPLTTKHVETWHEHQSYTGERVEFDAPIIHTRMLFRDRLLKQRGEEIVAKGGWENVVAIPLDDVATFDLEWLEGEPRGIAVDQVWEGTK